MAQLREGSTVAGKQIAVKAPDGKIEGVAQSAAAIDWTNVLNKPYFADPHWKGMKTSVSALPTTGNAIGDIYLVADGGEGQGALYRCIATSGTIAEQFVNDGAVNWSGADWANVLNKPNTIEEYKIEELRGGFSSELFWMSV